MGGEQRGVGGGDDPDGYSCSGNRRGPFQFGWQISAPAAPVAPIAGVMRGDITATGSHGDAQTTFTQAPSRRGGTAPSA